MATDALFRPGSLIVEYSEAMAAFFVPRQQGTPLPAAVAEGNATLEAPQTAAAVRQRTRRTGRLRVRAAVAGTVVGPPSPRRRGPPEFPPRHTNRPQARTAQRHSAS